MTTPMPPGRVDSGGTMWRLRSLMAMGHDATRIAAALAITPARARRLITGRTPAVTPELRDLAARLWDAWWDKTPPQHTPPQRRACATARRTAQRNNWPQPAALDEDQLDQPGYRPYSIWRPATGTGTAPAFHPAASIRTSARTTPPAQSPHAIPRSQPPAGPRTSATSQNPPPGQAAASSGP